MPPSDNDTGADPESSAARSLETSALLSRLGDEVALYDLEVTENHAITPSMRRIVCTAPGLSTLSYFAGQDFMFAVPAVGGESFRRRYTIRRVDRSKAALEIDVVLHGDGPGARWASSAQPGDHIEAIGPRGKIGIDSVADWHFFAGDDSAIPASLAMAETLASPERAIVILEVNAATDRQRASTLNGAPLSIQWLERGEGDRASSERLVAALEALDWPEGRGHAYLAGELGVVGAMRRTLAARGMGPDQISAKPYWRRGVANASHGEPPKP